MLTHGKASTARAGCDCVPCRNAVRRTRRDDYYRREKAGERLYRPAEEGQRIIRELREMGWTDIEIANDGLLNRNTVYRIANGQRKYVHVDTLKTLTQLLERGKRPKRHAGRIEADLSMRAIRGLQAQGWTASWIGERVGLNYQEVSRYARGTVRWISPDRERRIVQLAREVGSKEGPSNCVRNAAARKGWKPTIWVDELV